MVRIRLPPAESLRTIGSSAAEPGWQPRTASGDPGLHRRNGGESALNLSGRAQRRIALCLVPLLGVRPRQNNQIGGHERGCHNAQYTLIPLTASWPGAGLCWEWQILSSRPIPQISPKIQLILVPMAYAADACRDYPRAVDRSSGGPIIMISAPLIRWRAFKTGKPNFPRLAMAARPPAPRVPGFSRAVVSQSRRSAYLLPPPPENRR
jgi:hypothetical protein